MDECVKLGGDDYICRLVLKGRGGRLVLKESWCYRGIDVEGEFVLKWSCR